MGASLKVFSFVLLIKSFPGYRSFPIVETFPDIVLIFSADESFFFVFHLDPFLSSLNQHVVDI